MREVDCFIGIEETHVIDRHREDLRCAGKVNGIRGYLGTLPLRIIFVDLYDTVGSIAFVHFKRYIARNLDETRADTTHERLI